MSVILVLFILFLEMVAHLLVLNLVGDIQRNLQLLYHLVATMSGNTQVEVHWTFPVGEPWSVVPVVMKEH